jgi:LysM repeat protein
MATITTLINGVKVDAKTRMVIQTENGYTIRVPYAPQNIEHGEYGAKWDESERAGTYSVLRNTGKKGQTLSFDLTLASIHRGTTLMNTGKTVVNALKAFDKMADMGDRVYITFTERENGTWLLTNQSQSVTMRDAMQQPIRATVSLTFARIMNHKAFNGPINGRSSILTAKPSTSKKTVTSPNLATYKVKKGDTLWDLANKYYSNPYRWTSIADRNRIKNPKLLQIGTTLVIPRL